MTTSSPRENDATATVKDPYVAVIVRASGLHPASARMITLTAVTFDEEGNFAQSRDFVLNPGEDPGPKHLHGLSHEEVAEGQRFSQILKQLDSLIDNRTLVVHDAPRTWGFVVSEARRAMTAAARANRSRRRGNQRPRRRRKVGRVPTPVKIVDTLATARRQAKFPNDTRLEAVARGYGLKTAGPQASVQRAESDRGALDREAARLLAQLFLVQSAAGELASRKADEVKADKFGMQRSLVRVQAVRQEPKQENPGVYVPGKSLLPGMEIVVAPEIEMDPNTIISAILEAGLKYSEKLSRQTSLVVCNQVTDLRGKAMHAARKDIPLMADTAFLAAVKRMGE